MRQAKTIFVVATAWALLSQQLWADGGMIFPSNTDIQKAQQQSRSVLNSIPDANTVQQQFGVVGIPHVEQVPAPISTAKTDIAELARQFQGTGTATLSSTPKYDLLIMASLSMPREALKRLAEQAQRAHATFIFRGLSGNSMTQMSRDVRNAMGGVPASIVINPPAFKQFSVTRVPAIVIATHQAGNVLESGCSKAQTYVKVSGDVSLDYALDYIERKNPQWKNVAHEFRSRIVRGIN